MPPETSSVTFVESFSVSGISALHTFIHTQLLLCPIKSCVDGLNDCLRDLVMPLVILTFFKFHSAVGVDALKGSLIGTRALLYP